MSNPEIKNKGHELPDGLPRYRLLTGNDPGPNSVQC